MPYELVFPNSVGHVAYHPNIVQRVLLPVQVAAGVVTATQSWCINRKIDGGLELPPKIVQARLGHASIVMTMDIYGHLFPETDDGSELAKAEGVLLCALTRHKRDMADKTQAKTMFDRRAMICGTAPYICAAAALNSCAADTMLLRCGRLPG